MTPTPSEARAPSPIVKEYDESAFRDFGDFLRTHHIRPVRVKKGALCATEEEIDRVRSEIQNATTELVNHVAHTWAAKITILYAGELHLNVGGAYTNNTLGTVIHNALSALTATAWAIIGELDAFGIEVIGTPNEDMTLYQLGKLVDEERQKRQSAKPNSNTFYEISALILQTVESAAYNGAKIGSKEGVQRTLPKVYAKTATMSDEELRASTKPKTRKPGGGRKQTKDIGDKQVKAVLADMEKHKRESFRAYSGQIIRTMKNGNYTNPYTTEKDLDAAVRRYCKKHNITPSALTKRTGKWRSTK